MDGELQKYLSSLTRKLKLDPRTNGEIVLELQCHLEEKIVELQEEGLTYEEARHRAVQDLGQPELIAKGMYSVHSKGSWRDIAVATLPHLLLASLFALHLSTRYLLIAGLVAAVTAVTLLAWRSGRPKWTYTWLGYSMMAPAVSWLMAPGGPGIRHLDVPDHGSLALQPPDIPADRGLPPLLSVGDGQRGAEGGASGLAVGLPHRPSLPLPHIVDIVPQLAQRPVGGKLRPDPSERWRPGAGVPGAGRHHRSFPQAGPQDVQDCPCLQSPPHC